MTDSPSSATGVVWDLSDLFAAPDDPRMDQALDACQADAEAFANTYRGTIDMTGGPAPEHLLAGIVQMERIIERAYRVGAYAGLLYAADTSSPVHRKLQQKVEQRMTALRNVMLFFDLEWLELSDEDAAKLIEHPLLAEYRHYLRAERRYRPHRLTEPEEKVVNEKDVTGRQAWGRLFTELTSSLSFPVERDGQTRDLSLAETLALYHEPDRALRKRAHDSLFGVLERNGQVLTFTYDTLVQDGLTMGRLRSYPDPMTPRHLSNEVDAGSVDQMMKVVEANYGIAHDYFRLKRTLVGIDELTIYDQYAPIGGKRERYTYEQARGSILQAFDKFSPEFADVARRFFDGHWIDAELRRGKRGGAFCMSPSPQVHPYVLCNYTDNLRDAMTVAHELGHGIHGYLSLGQKLVNYHPTLPLAETASVFAEMLVFDHLVEQVEDESTRLGLLCGKIEDIFATVFRQNVLTRFEQAAFAGRKVGRLTPEALQEAWISANAPYYGDAVRMTEGYRWGWSYIPHFIHSAFYCYSYVFGELLVLALYGMYRERGSAFVPEYRRLLAAGGSATPVELLGALGVDFGDPGFWQKGFAELSRLVAWANDLVVKQGMAQADAR